VDQSTTSTASAPAGDDRRGRQAETPTDVPAKGWKDVLARTFAEAKQDNVSLLAAGVAFFALLALVPALIALVSLYGLFADPSTVEENVRELLGAAPEEVRELVIAQLQSITQDANAAVGLAAVIGILIALWSASSGVKHLIEAINTAYDEDETRGFVKVRGLSLLLTLGALVFLVGAFFLIALLPSLLADTGLGDAARIAVGVLRWVVLLVGMVVALAILYHYGPDRDNPRWRWVSTGAIVATLLWLAGSALFAVYAANFGKYNETYGSLASVIVVMLWLYLTCAAILLGAELNAELERQTARDTTEGRSEALGQRGAEAADTVGATAEEVRAARQRR
jgi:membrane protein